MQIDGFKGLQNLDWRPDPGINLILGPNEAGKSTIAEFLEAMIFGLPGGSSGDALRPWSGGAFGGFVELDCENSTLRISREFGSGGFTYEERAQSGASTEKPLSGQLRRGSSGALAKRYAELLGRHMGFYDEKLFRRSLFVPQGDLAFGARDLATAAATLRSLSSGGGSTYDNALALLEKRYRQISSAGDRRRNIGTIDLLRQEREELLKKVRLGGSRNSEIAGIKERISSTEARLKALRVQRNEFSSSADVARKVEQLRTQRKALAAADRAAREKLNAAETSTKKASELDRQLERFSDLSKATTEFPELISNARSGYERVCRLEQHNKEVATGAPPQYRFGRFLLLAISFVVIGCALASTWTIYPHIALVLIGAGLILIGLVSGGIFWRFRSVAAGQSEKHQSSLKRASDELRNARDELRVVSASLMDQTGGRVEFESRAMDLLMERYADRLRLQTERDVLEANLPVEDQLQVLRVESAESVQGMAVLDERIEKLDQELKSLQPETEVSAALLERRRDELINSCKVTEKQLHELELAMARTDSSQGVTEADLERLSELEVCIPELESRYRALGLARTELRASISEFQDSHIDRLEDIAGELVSSFTLKRYREVALDRDSMVPGLRRSKTKLFPEEALSQGTRVALYLSIRMAMTQLISGGKSLPLILDDPFVDFDNGRRNAGLELLQTVAGDSQVILMTCDERLRWEGIAVLELPLIG